jgi:hypothetical protein
MMGVKGCHIYNVLGHQAAGCGVYMLAETSYKTGNIIDSTIENVIIERVFGKRKDKTTGATDSVQFQLESNPVIDGWGVCLGIQGDNASVWQNSGVKNIDIQSAPMGKALIHNKAKLQGLNTSSLAALGVLNATGLPTIVS